MSDLKAEDVVRAIDACQKQLAVSDLIQDGPHVAALFRVGEIRTLLAYIAEASILAVLYRQEGRARAAGFGAMVTVETLGKEVELHNAAHDAAIRSDIP